MPDQDTDDFCRLSTIGPSKEELLNDHGYYTYEDLALAHPVSLNQKCNIVLASATQIIVESMEKLSRVCPQCETEIEPSWAGAKIHRSNSDKDARCTECSWEGNLSETIEKSETETTISAGGTLSASGPTN